MITKDELLSGLAKESELTPELKNNLAELFAKINVIRTAYGKPMTVTSGYRSMKHHKEIYAAKGITDTSKIPMQSKHLYCQAVDIADGDGKLKAWLSNNVQLLENAGLWCEDFSCTKQWLHFQTVPPKSGKRFFMP